MLPVMMRLNTVAAGYGSAVSRRYFTNASSVHGHIGREQNNPRRILGVLFDQVTELVKIPEDTMQELGLCK